MNSVYQDPSGQVALYESEDRYLGLLTETFGQRFLDYRAAWHERAQRGAHGEFPLSLDLAINSGCQLHCLMCPLKSRSDAKEVRLLDEGLFHKVMAEAAERGLPAMTLGLGSEPLLNPKAAAWIEVAAKAGIMDIRLGTNALALTADTAKALVASGLTRLEISVDAAHPETYAQIRGGQLSALEKRIEDFLNIRSLAAQKLPLLRLSFLKLPQNNGELEAFLRRWHGLADMVSIQEAIWFPGSALPKPLTPLRPIAPNCAQPWQRLAINYEGSVWPCCSWYGEGLLAGNVERDSVAVIWDSAEMNALRQALAASPAAVCAQCAY